MAKTLTEEHKRKIGDANRGKSPWCKGKKLPPEFGEKISKTHKERGIKPGELCRSRSIEVVSKGRRAPSTYQKIVFEEMQIPKVCEMCNTTEDICVHHKDKDHTNNTRENIIVVCRSCHLKLHRGAGEILGHNTPKQGSE